MFDVAACEWSISEIDRALQTARMLRLSEGGYARDHFGNLMQGDNASAEKLDAYAAGVLTALVNNDGNDADAIGLLIYVFAVSDVGPGLPALAKASRMLRSESDDQLRAYFALGFRTVCRMVGGAPTSPGEFAKLLRGERAGIANGHGEL